MAHQKLHFRTSCKRKVQKHGNRLLIMVCYNITNEQLTRCPCVSTDFTHGLPVHKWLPIGSFCNYPSAAASNTCAASAGERLQQTNTNDIFARVADGNLSVIIFLSFRLSVCESSMSRLKSNGLKRTMAHSKAYHSILVINCNFLVKYQ